MVLTLPPEKTFTAMRTWVTMARVGPTCPIPPGDSPMKPFSPLCLVAALLVAPGFVAAGPKLVLDTPMSPPTWALLQRQLLRSNTEACREFYRRYFDDRGWLLCVERWGGDDGA